MKEILQYVDAHWVEWLFVVISTLLSVGYRRLSKQMQEEKVKNEAIQDGIQALLRDRIIQSYNCLLYTSRCV